MIKYYKITLGNEGNQLSAISKSILTGYKTDSIIVSLDNNKTYYHSPKSGSKPILIGSTDKYKYLSTSTVANLTLQPNTNYVTDENHAGYAYTLPTTTSNCSLQLGDIIRLYNKCNNTAALTFTHATAACSTIPASASHNRLFVYRYNGSGRWVMLSTIIYPDQLPTATTQDIGGVKVADAITSFNLYEDLNVANWYAKDSVTQAGSLYNIVCGLVRTITGDLFSTAEVKVGSNYAEMVTEHLPFANTSGKYGIVTLLSASAPSAISGSSDPMAASAIYNYITGNVNTYTSSSLSAVKLQINNVITALVDGGTTRQANISSLVEYSNTSAGIVNSPKPIAASAVYSYITTNIGNITTNCLTGVTLDGNSGTISNRVVNLGNITLNVNNTNKNATSAHVIQMGDGWVQVTGTISSGYYVRRTSNGWTTDPGIATLSSSVNITNWNSTTNYNLDADNKAIPVAIKTGAGNVYPIEKGTISVQANTGHFLIDTRPYMVYDGVTSFSGPWIIYYGAGINDVYSTANTIQSISVAAGTNTQTINFNSGDIAIVTVTGSSNNAVQLLVTNVPVGHGMIIKIINDAGRLIKFALRTIVSSTGTYSVSVFNFGDGPEQVGEVTAVYSVPES